MNLRHRFIAPLMATCISNAALAATIEIGSASGPRGAEVEFDVVLQTGGDEVAGTENVIVFPDDLDPVGCSVDPNLHREASAFSKTSSGCRYKPCNSVKALILDFFDLSPLDDGVTLYSCRARIAPNANEGEHLIECTAPGASTPDGTPIDTYCRPGSVQVIASPALPTRVTIPTPTWLPSPTQGPFPTPTLRYPAPAEEHFLFLETDLVQVSAAWGWTVAIYATYLGSHVDSLWESNCCIYELVDFRFSRSPEVGIALEFDTTNDPQYYFYLDRRAKHAIPALLLPAESTVYRGEVVITAEAGGQRAQTSIWITPEGDHRSIRSVAVTTDRETIGERNDRRIEVVAQVLDSAGEPVNGVPVLFRSEAGVFEPTVAMAEADRDRDGVARATLTVRDGAEARFNPTTGALAPYTITARSGQVTGYSEVFVLPGEVVGDGRTSESPTSRAAVEDDGCAVVSPTGDNPSPALAWLAFLLLPWLGARRLRRAPIPVRRRSLRR